MLKRVDDKLTSLFYIESAVALVANAITNINFIYNDFHQTTNFQLGAAADVINKLTLMQIGILQGVSMIILWTKLKIKI